MGAALAISTANGLYGVGLANALVYRHGLMGEEMVFMDAGSRGADDQNPWANTRGCRRLAQQVWRASEAAGAVHALLEQRADYVAAVEAYLSEGCGGEGRDLQALRKMQTAANDAGS